MKRAKSTTKKNFLRLWDTRGDKSIPEEQAWKWFSLGNASGHQRTESYFLETIVKKFKAMRSDK